VACSVTEELEPTAAVPLPDPLDVKYANAMPAMVSAPAQASAASALFRVIKPIFVSPSWL
jgi:hypothetical protein